VIADRLYAVVAYDRLKHNCVISILMLFIVIAAFRPVNKNVSTSAVIRAKWCTEPGVHKPSIIKLVV